VAGAMAQTPPSTINNFTVMYGTVEYKTDKGKSILYFTDHGNKFREDNFGGDGKLRYTEIYDGNYLFSIQADRVDTIGMIKNRYFMSADQNGYKRNKNFKKLSPKTIAGKQCEGFEYFNTVINKTIIIYGWNNIQMEYTVDGVSYKVAEIFNPVKPSIPFKL
jgi:hypothetical protein